MAHPRSIFVLLAALSVAACSNTSPFAPQTTTQFGVGPLGFSQNPTLKTKVSHSFVTNEAELMSAAERIKAAQLDTLETDEEEAISARSVISPL